MKRKMSLILIVVMVLGLSLQSHAINSEAPHIYYKYTVKTWWDKNNNNDLYKKEPIYSNVFEYVPYSSGYTATIYLDAESISGYTGYEVTPTLINGHISYKVTATNARRLKIGDIRFLVNDTGYSKEEYIEKFTPFPDILPNRRAFKFQSLGEYALKLNYYIYEHKDKDIFLSEIIAPGGTYPSNGLHVDGYWYVDMGVLNKTPSISVIQPITNQRIGNQDNLIINGTVKDEDVGDTLSIKYLINNEAASNITLTQPTSLISNGQAQSFQGYIKLNGLLSGDNKLKLWTEDNKGAMSNIVEITIIAFNTLENVMKSLKSYTYKSGEPQYLVVNSSNTITQSIDNDYLISQIKRELEAKNIKLFFIGKDGTTESYINTKLLSN